MRFKFAMKRAAITIRPTKPVSSRRIRSKVVFDFDDLKKKLITEYFATGDIQFGHEKAPLISSVYLDVLVFGFTCVVQQNHHRHGLT